MDEIWKDVAGYEGYYQVSNLGRVKSVDRCITGKKGYSTLVLKKGEILSPRLTAGCLQVTFIKGGKKTYKEVHKLVAEAFIPNPNNYTVVNHINGDIQDNTAVNLEWSVPKSCNEDYIWVYLPVRALSLEYKAPRKWAKPVTQLDQNGNVVRTYNSMAEAAKVVGCSPSAISIACSNKRKTAKGYKWKRS